ncbi:ABC transporter substrate-binding protein [Arthrobacter crystallopoietes]|uniref:ABC transporter substrate-binding protein n=1 Tax=Crystallibacter crystallopoietes TaxID=37928 RepID=UPI003D2415EA
MPEFPVPVRKHPRRLGRVAGALVGLAALLAVSACGGSAGSNDALTKVSVGHAAGFTNVPLYVAMDRGYFKEEGLDVELKAFKSGGDMVAPLSSGSLDAGTGAPGAGIFNAVGRGLGVRLVGDTGHLDEGNKYSSLIVRKELVDSGKFSSIKDLKDLRMGLYAEGTSTTLWFDRALAEAGLTRADIQPNFLGGPDQAAGLENGSIDAATLAEPFASKVIDSGAAVRFAVGADFYPGLQLGTLMYGTAFTQKAPETAVAFMEGWLRGTRDFNAAIVDGQLKGEGSDEIVRIIAKHTDMDEALLKSAYFPAISGDGTMNVEGLGEDLETFRKDGLIENKDLKIEDILDTSYAEKAQAELSAAK